MLIALGLALPMIFHALGLGSVFLPMFWPVVIGAFFLPLPFALLLGLLTPFLSALLTGMPPFAPPIAYLMAAELTTLAGLIALLHGRAHLGLFGSLLAALAISRIVYYGAVTLLAEWLGLPARLFSLAAVVRTLPGLILLLVFIPIIVNRISKITGGRRENG